MIKYVTVVALSAFLAGCVTNMSGYDETVYRQPSTKIITPAPKIIVKTKVRVVEKIKTIPVPSEKPFKPNPLVIDPKLFDCPLLESFPNPDTLTDVQVKGVIQKLVDLNKTCHYNSLQVKAKIDEYNKYLDMGEKFDG